MLIADTEGGTLPSDPFERPTRFDEALLNALPVAVCTLDADGAVLHYNRLADELCGGTLSAHGHLRLVSSDGQLQPLAQTPLAYTIRTGRVAQDVALFLERPDGVPAPVLANIEALRNDSGKITGAVVCFQASTPARQSSADRRRNLDWLSAIVENTPECVKVVDRDGTLVQMNPAGLQMLEAGCAEDVEGGCVFDLVAPEHRQLWVAQHLRVCDGEKLSWEFDIINLAGHRRHMETHAVPMMLPAESRNSQCGYVQLALTRDVTERKQLEAANLEAEQRLCDLLEALPTAVYTTDANGRLRYFNQACVDLAGRVPVVGVDQWCVAWRLYWPDGTPMRHENYPMAIALSEDKPIRGAEALAERPDGTRVPFLAYPAPLRSGAGELIGAVNMLVDITERKVAEDRRQLLLNELNHRVKNTLATVQSIAAQSFRQDQKGQGFRWFEGRLMALSKAHDVLSQENWQTASLNDIVDQAAAPFQAHGQRRFITEGPCQRLRPKAALGLAMALHELCTNATKYGALVSDTGYVSIRWQVTDDAASQRLRLHWQETGGPSVSPPERKGFGSRLLERGLASELNADVRLTYPMEGLECHIEVPLT